MENKEEIPVYSVEFDEAQSEGISMISFVNKPAIKRNFVALSEITNDLKCKFSQIDEYKMQVTGAVLVPDEKILRLGENDEPYYIEFSAEVIEKIRNNFMRKKAIDKTNLEHQENLELSGNYVIESYIITNDLQNTKLGLPVGSFVLTYQISDETFFKEKILTKDVNGFSLEGTFTFTDKNITSKMQEVEIKPKSDFDVIKELLSL